MKTALLAAPLLTITLAAPLAAASPQGSPRTVQLITMGVPAPPRLSAAAGTDGTDGSDKPAADEGAPLAEASPAALPASFSVHDLSRKWVQFQMAQTYGQAVSGEASPVDLAAPGAAPPVAAAPGVFAAPTLEAIPVPAWMRGGLAFASAATRYTPGCYAGGYRPAGFLSAQAEIRRAGYYGIMSAIACQYGIPVGLFDAMIIRESRYNDRAVSPKNAYGLTQLMPGTAAGLGVDRYDIEQNLHGGARYLRSQLDRFGQVHLALAAYNAGPGRVRGGQVPRIAETQAYVDDILLNWRRLSGFTRTASVTGPSLPPTPTSPRFNGRSAIVSRF
ncbi:Lytic transglycosylase, catalytic [Novosphingobium resinovorum]|uniref:Lytic transglycosylase, catalytic n=2 Tax=Novosphingobium resinovorum TaxID=158500 RepID=A0A031JPK8_9SPHN|nr:Lytic transglycosylase, catalytic [Novosphingobium resinovorum]